MNFILETEQYSEKKTALARTEPFWQLSTVNLDEDVKMSFLTHEKIFTKKDVHIRPKFAKRERNDQI